MIAVIGNALGFAAIIVLGWCARSLHLVNRDVKRILPELMLSITLPASIVSNLNGQALPLEDLPFLVLGCLFNCTALLLAWLIGREREGKAFLMVSTAGFNIGCFAMPFVQGLFPHEAIVRASLFDIGNSLMCLGLNFGIVSQVKHGGGAAGGVNVRMMLRSVYRSVPVLTYFLMFALCALRIELPYGLVHAVQVAGNANPFIAMMVIGVSIDFTGGMGSGCESRRTFVKTVAGCCGLRLVHSIVAAVLLAMLPAPLTVKGAAMCLVFAPIGAVSSVYARRLDLDDALAACVNSCYVPLSIAAMSAVIMLSGIAGV